MSYKDMDRRGTGRREGALKSSEEERRTSEKASPAAVERYIKGVHFPAQKEDLVNQAEQNGAPQDVLNVLNRFSDKDYNTAIDIAKEVPKAEG